MNAITQIHPLQTSALVQSMLNAIAADEIAERLIPLSNEYQAQALDAARLDRSEAKRAALKIVGVDPDKLMRVLCAPLSPFAWRNSAPPISQPGSQQTARKCRRRLTLMR